MLLGAARGRGGGEAEREREAVVVEVGLAAFGEQDLGEGHFERSRARRHRPVSLTGS
jgi:hypothetical protein